MSNKTAAMVLQELSIKKCGRGPDFDLITQNQGTHENEFEYIVHVLGITARGRGRSKKEAKQETSLNALKILKEKFQFDWTPTTPNPPPQSTFQQLSPDDCDLPHTINYIGDLSDLCAVNNLPPPMYDLILDDGPAHNKVFTYECRLGSSLVTRSTSSTKKHARQNASRMMLERIQDIIPALCKEQENEQLKLCDNDMDAIDKYLALTAKGNLNFGMKLANYHLHLRELMQELNITYDDIKEYFEEKPRSLENLKELLGKMKLELLIEDLTEDNSSVYIIAINVTTKVPLCSINKGKNKQIAFEGCLMELYKQMATLSSARAVV